MAVHTVEAYCCSVVGCQQRFLGDCAGSSYQGNQSCIKDNEEVRYSFVLDGMCVRGFVVINIRYYRCCFDFCICGVVDLCCILETSNTLHDR